MPIDRSINSHHPTQKVEPLLLDGAQLSAQVLDFRVLIAQTLAQGHGLLESIHAIVEWKQRRPDMLALGVVVGDVGREANGEAGGCCGCRPNPMMVMSMTVDHH